ncbi:hypothetical protein pb186bvf_014780 [Paramecium bursaria]
MKSLSCCNLKKYMTIRERSRSKEKEKTQQDSQPYDLYNLEQGKIMNNQYKYFEDICDGTFGRVILAMDLQTNQMRAIKIYKDPNDGNADIEYRIYEQIQQDGFETPEKTCIQKCYEIFNYYDYKCLVFERLGLSVYQTLKLNNFKPFYLKFIQVILKNVLMGIQYMHQQGFIHTDIKPENIVFRSNTNFEVKIIDLGNCECEKDQIKPQTVTTVNYRAPEVLLKQSWSYPVDVWSIGCLAHELYTGNQLMPNVTDDVKFHLALIQRIGSDFTEEMKQNFDYFDKKGRLKFPEHGKHKSSHELQVVRTRKMDSTNPYFNDLINRMTIIDPLKRITAKECLDHDFFKQDIL